MLLAARPPSGAGRRWCAALRRPAPLLLGGAALAVGVEQLEQREAGKAGDHHQRRHGDLEHAPTRLVALFALAFALLALVDLALDALLDEAAIDRGQVLRPASEPLLRLGQRQAHEQGVVAGMCRRCLPGPARALQTAAPGEELALGGDPLAELAPALEDRLMGDLGIGLAAFRRGGDEQPMGMVGELGDHAPLVLAELGAQRPAAGGLAVLAHGGELEGEQAAQRRLGLGMAGEEGIGALGEDAAELHGLGRQAHDAIAAADHVGPHVVEQIGEQRQGAGIARRLLRRAAGEIGGELVALETGREQRRRLGDHLPQLGLAQRRHVDLAVDGEQRLVVLQRAEEIGAQAHQGVEARIGNGIGEQAREGGALRFLGADVELLALIDIEEEGRRLGLAELLVAALGGVEQAGERRLAGGERADPVAAPLLPFRVGRIDLPGPEEGLDQRLDGVGARLHLEEAPAPAVVKGRRPRRRLGDAFRPGLALQRAEHAGLGERRLADAGIADEHGQALAARRRWRRARRWSPARARRRNRCPPRSSRQGRDRARCSATVRRAARRRRWWRP